MPTIHLSTHISAPIQTVFDLARSIELHLKSTAHTQERVVAGKCSGLCEVGDELTWEAVHFGIRQRLSVRITKMERPYFFEDQMTRGAFQSFTHQHIFEASATGTIMKDTFTFRAPFGILGDFISALILKRYMTNLLLKRNQLIQQIAENDPASIL